MSVLVINATNLRDGGGVTHLVEILKNVDFDRYIFNKVVVVGPESTLDKIENRSWLYKKSHYLLNKDFLYIQLWRIFCFNSFLRKNECALLFDPGGGYNGNYRPFITMCRNMLVFEHSERKRYKYSLVYFRLLVLRKLQLISFKNASGVIFISKYAEEFLKRELKLELHSTTTINHGVSAQFDLAVKEQKNIYSYSAKLPFKLLYVSIIDLYKHQDKVAEAVIMLNQIDRFPIEVSFVGPLYKPAFSKLAKWLSGDYRSIIKYLGKVDYFSLREVYQQADAFIFASSCENMPNILIEAMRSGLPVSCSNKGPMPEFLKNNGYYFNPEDVQSIYSALKLMVLNSSERMQYAIASKSDSYQYEWSRCAHETFAFLESEYNKQK